MKLYNLSFKFFGKATSGFSGHKYSSILYYYVFILYDLKESVQFIVTYPKLYVYLVGLYKKLPKDAITGVDLKEFLSLDYYKLEKISEGSISVNKGEGELVSVGSGRGKKEEKLESLDEIIARINEIYGIGLTDGDKVMMEDIEKRFTEDPKVQQMAKVNSQEDFTKLFKKNFKRGLVRQKKDFENVVTNILSNEGLTNHLMNIIAEKVYDNMQENMNN